MTLSSVHGGENQTLSRKIAITIDDAPLGSSRLFTPLQRANSIIEKIRQLNGPAIAVFAVGNHIEKFGDKDLLAYEKAGHIICNHTETHRALSQISAEDFIYDVQKSHSRICSYRGFLPYFRYPYLDYGTPEKKLVVAQALKQMGYQEGYVTISTFDWYINALLLNKINDVGFEELKRTYVKMLADCAAQEFYLASRCGLNYPVHILLLHANDLNALFMGDLIAELLKRGWEVISAAEAYQLNEKSPPNSSKKDLILYYYNCQQPHPLLQLPYLKELFSQKNLQKSRQ